MKPLILAFALTPLLITMPATAAFKCTVDGKTTYQETPCSDDVKTRGAQSVIATPSKKTDSERGEISATENKRRDALVKSDLEPRAREAFGALKGGRTMAYRDMLCLRSRQLLSRPEMANALKDAASDYTKRNIEITTVKNASSGGVSFNTVPKTPEKKNSSQTVVHVHFDYEGDKPCVTHIEGY
jgi:hypothetical protein